MMLCKRLGGVIGAVASLCMVAAAQPVAQTPQAAWHTHGGMVGGHFVSDRAKRDWPLWVRGLLGTNTPVAVTELNKADLYKVPDAFLVQALDVLTDKEVFTPSLLKQVCAIQHAAEAVAFQRAKIRYQVAYFQKKGLPVADTALCSTLASQLVWAGYRKEVAIALAAQPFPPGDLAMQNAFRRMVGETPSREAVLHRGRPAMERFFFLTRVTGQGDPMPLLESFRGTPYLDRAVFYGLEKEWLTPLHPLAGEVCASFKARPAGPWCLVRPIERASDIGWRRTLALLQDGQQKAALQEAKRLLTVHPYSYYAGHAATLVGALEPTKGTLELGFRVPADVTLFNAEWLEEKAQPVSNVWPAGYKALADKGRFDLILFQVDRHQDVKVFLQAAHACGQIDIIGRFLAAERQFGLDTLAYVYPTFLAKTVEQILREEDMDKVVDTAFVLAMMKNESLFQPIAQSPSKAFGLLQLLKPTFQELMGKRADIQHPETNIRGGIRYYSRIAKAADLWDLPPVVRQAYVAAGYHAGKNRAKRWKKEIEGYCKCQADPIASLYRMHAIPISTTRHYVERVLGDAEIYRALLKAKAPSPSRKGQTARHQK